MSWTHDAHGNLRDEVISITPRGGKVQHVAESVVHFSDVTFRVSTSGVKYQNIRNGGKRAVCAWMRGTLDNVSEIAGNPFRFTLKRTAPVALKSTVPQKLSMSHQRRLIIQLKPVSISGTLTEREKTIMTDKELDTFQKALMYRMRKLVEMSELQKDAIAIELGLESSQSVTIDKLEEYLLRYDNQHARRHGKNARMVTIQRHEFEASQV